jgi:hypothetical protein
MVELRDQRREGVKELLFDVAFLFFSFPLCDKMSRRGKEKKRKE